MATRVKTLDVGSLRDFDALRPGESLVVVADHEPRALLAELQTSRPGEYVWNVLGMRPTFRVEVERRPDRASRDVSRFLGQDHDRLDALLESARASVADGEIDAARASFGEFAAGLIHHIQMEENVLFPAFEEVTGFLGGPTVVMRSEHREIGRLLQAAKDALAASDRAGFEAEGAELVSVLGRHNQKEEAILYPMTDRRLSDAEREDLVRALESQSCDAPCGCCSRAPEGTARGRRLEVRGGP
jgi:uncharacterized protein (DUF2249 family)